MFSDKTPVYFRVDLLRVIAAFNTLENANELGKKHYFAYGDIDVVPLSKERLFDEKTQKYLDDFGIVMAHGGLNQYSFENSFQMFSSDKPNLLKAMKEAIIDINIARANYILNWGNWGYSKSYDTQPLEQKIYDSYNAMFHYYYHLQGWGQAKNGNQPVNLDQQSGSSVFGLQSDKQLQFEAKDAIVKVEKDEFDFRGKLKHNSRLRIPRKIIAAPASRFGGTPTTFDPNRITIDNFKQKLTEELSKKEKFNNTFL